MVVQNPYHDSIDYGEGYWQAVTDPDGKTRNLLEERDFRIKNWYGNIPDLINRMPPGKILDVGCGPGHLLSAIDGCHKKFGLEISDLCIGHIKRHYPEITVRKGTLDSCPDLPDDFDIIVLYHVLEHLENPLAVLNSIRALLKDSGSLILGTPNIGGFCARRFKGNFRLLGHPHLSLFNEKTLTAMLAKAGFTVTRKEFPFFQTAYFTLSNLLRLRDARKLSPPFYKNVMTFYASKDAA